MNCHVSYHFTFIPRLKFKDITMAVAIGMGPGTRLPV